MQKRLITLASVAAVVAAVALAAIVFGPGNLGNLGNPNSPGTGTPQTRSIGVPTWSVGDTWTYEVNQSLHMRLETYPHAVGTITRTVVSADGSQYNVSIEGSFTLRADAVIMSGDPAKPAIWPPAPITKELAVSGYSWYRTSDLAKIKDVRAIATSGSMTTDQGTYSWALASRVETTYEPALDVWAFPIEENETWEVTGNATVEVESRWLYETPDSHAEFEWNATYVIPIDLTLRSGETEDVVTPAGTFAAIPVHVVVFADELRQPREDPMMGLDTGEHIEYPGALTVWFSEAAKGPVQVSLGRHLEAVLVSYDVS